MIRDPESILTEEDAAAYRRFLDWSVGDGFDLAIVRVGSRSKREALVAWTKAQIPTAYDVNLRQVDPDKKKLWELLEAAKSTDASALLLYGLEESAAKSRIIAQLNVERDELVKAFALPWILFVHPFVYPELLQKAPDFVDFAGLWLEEAVAETRPAIPIPQFPAVIHTVTRIDESLFSDALLQRALDAVNASKLDEAKDLLATFDLEHPDPGPDMAFRMHVGGMLSFALNDLPAARMQVETALTLLTEAVETREHAVFAMMLYSLSTIEYFAGKYDEARRFIDEAFDIHRKLNREASADLVPLLDLRMFIAIEQGDFAFARQSAEQSLALKQKFHDNDQIAIVRSLEQLSLIDYLEGQVENAREKLQQALELRIRILGTDEDLSVVGTMKSLAGVLERAGDIQAAREWLDRSLAIEQRMHGAPTSDSTLQHLARIYRTEGKLDDAKACIEKVLVQQKQRYGTENHPDSAKALDVLAAILFDLGQLDRARDTYEKAIAILEQVHGTSDHYLIANYRANLAAVHRELGQFEKAKELLSRAFLTSASKLGTNHPQTQQMAALLAN
jgi:tetratricopeptide (TPR) repeat protein